MARIRTIKPEFFRHERLAELSALHRLLFIGLWTLADRFGRLEDRPKRIKVELLPYDSGDIHKMLTALAEAGFIVRYVVDGASYIAIPSFTEHQRVTGREAATPETIPPPPGHHSGHSGEAPKLCHGTTRDTLGKQQGNNAETPGHHSGHSGDHRKGKEYRERSIGKDDDDRASDAVGQPVGPRVVEAGASSSSGPPGRVMLAAQEAHALWVAALPDAPPAAWADIQPQGRRTIAEFTQRLGLDRVEAFVQRVAASDYLAGRKDLPPMDFFSAIQRADRILAGAYDNRTDGQQAMYDAVLRDLDAQIAAEAKTAGGRS